MYAHYIYVYIYSKNYELSNNFTYNDERDNLINQNFLHNISHKIVNAIQNFIYHKY